MAANYYKYSANMNDRTYFTSVVTTTSGAAKRYFSNVESEIYFGDKEKCMRVMNEVNGNFIHNNEKCVECNGLYCHKCEELKKFINDVKFTRRMTNREVAKWLAEGKGEVKVNDTLYPSCYYTYIIGSENIEVGQGTFIREWDSDEWKEPLIEMEQ